MIILLMHSHGGSFMSMSCYGHWTVKPRKTVPLFKPLESYDLMHLAMPIFIDSAWCIHDKQMDMWDHMMDIWWKSEIEWNGMKWSWLGVDQQIQQDAIKQLVLDRASFEHSSPRQLADCLQQETLEAGQTLARGMTEVSKTIQKMRSWQRYDRGIHLLIQVYINVSCNVQDPFMSETFLKPIDT